MVYEAHIGEGFLCSGASLMGFCVRSSIVQILEAEDQESVISLMLSINLRRLFIREIFYAISISDMIIDKHPVT